MEEETIHTNANNNNQENDFNSINQQIKKVKIE